MFNVLSNQSHVGDWSCNYNINSGVPGWETTSEGRKETQIAHGNRAPLLQDSFLALCARAVWEHMFSAKK